LDWSGSGQTAYVEPFSVVDMNNRLEELRFMEEQEIYRIFQELCSQLYPIAEEIRISLRILGKLMQLTPRQNGDLPCVVHCQDITKWAYQYKRCQASSHPTGSCSACGHCGPEGRIGVILSGPNTGGKTVTLKNHWALCRSAKDWCASASCGCTIASLQPHINGHWRSAEY